MNEKQHLNTSNERYFDNLPRRLHINLPRGSSIKYTLQLLNLDNMY